MLERLPEHLAAQLPLRCVRTYNAPPFLNGIGSLCCKRATTSTHRIGKPGAPLRVDVGVFPAGEETSDLRVAVDGGGTHHFTYAISDEDREQNMRDVSRVITTFLLDEVGRKRDDDSAGPLLSKVPPHVPMLLLSEDGTIQEITTGARRLLEHPPDASIDPLFFSHVHGQNLRRVMQDLAQMASRRKQRTRWLLRLQTGNGRWRWYRAQAMRVSGSSDHSVRVLLRRL